MGDDETPDPEQQVYSQALRRINTLHSRLMDNDDFMEWQRLLDFVSMYDDLATRANGKPRGRKPSDPSLIPFLEKTLKESPKPMSTRELLQAAREAGLEVGGTEPIRNLSARLSGHPLFKVSNDGAGWVLKSVEDLL